MLPTNQNTIRKPQTPYQHRPLTATGGPGLMPQPAHFQKVSVIMGGYLWEVWSLPTFDGAVIGDACIELRIISLAVTSAASASASWNAPHQSEYYQETSNTIPTQAPHSYRWTWPHATTCPFPKGECHHGWVWFYLWEVWSLPTFDGAVTGDACIELRIISLAVTSAASASWNAPHQSEYYQETSNTIPTQAPHSYRWTWPHATTCPFPKGECHHGWVWFYLWEVWSLPTFDGAVIGDACIELGIISLAVTSAASASWNAPHQSEYYQETSNTIPTQAPHSYRWTWPHATTCPFPKGECHHGWVWFYLWEVWSLPTFDGAVTGDACIELRIISLAVTSAVSASCTAPHQSEFPGGL